MAASHFLRVARKEMERAGAEVPLFVSHKRLLKRERLLGRVWLGPGRSVAPSAVLDY